MCREKKESALREAPKYQLTSPLLAKNASQLALKLEIEAFSGAILKAGVYLPPNFGGQHA